MEWQEKIKEGMKLIGEGCSEGERPFVICSGTCPFADYCWILKKQAFKNKYDLFYPSFWNKIF